ncbi:hypothetical protein ACFW4A_003775 [Escherichia coli]
MASPFNGLLGKLQYTGDHEWKRLYTTLRRRADDRRQCHRVMQGDDPEGIVWFPDCYPQIYYY